MPDAAITANISQSARPPLIYPVSKRGNGNLKLYGNFNGPVDAKYDVKVLDTALEKPVVSTPTFRGAGTGKITGISVSGLQAQNIRVLCLSTGTDTTHAEIEIEGIQFRAKAEGSVGNAIRIIVDDTTLQFTQTDYSTIKALKTGDTALEGQEWDFDTKVLQGSNVPADAHRLSFGQDHLHIYLQYKKFEDGKWKYYTVPEIRYDVISGSRVYFVTGGRKITVTDGTTIEEYSGIVSIADFWQQVKNLSALIEPVSSSIDTSRDVASPGVREFATKTDAYFLPPYKADQSSEYAGALESIGVTQDAKTELIEIKCSDNTYVGQEIWDVKGSSSGDMGQVRTGLLSDFGFLHFLIPQEFPAAWGQIKEDWSYEVKYASRDSDVTPPPICFSMRLGINAAAQTLTLTYRKKPPACNCPPATFSDKCLGLIPEGGEIGMAYTVPDLLFWTDARMDVKIEGSYNQYFGYEPGEGRGGSLPAVTFLQTISGAFQPYVTNFKALAQRLMNLTEDAPSSLQSMVDQYKSLIESLVVAMYGEQPGTEPGSLQDFIYEVTYNTSAYLSLVESVLNYERTYGVKKNSIVAPGTCYIDAGGDYYWEVRGGKAYLPAFTGTPYYSTVKSGDDYSATKEFAFLISVPCGGALIEGDEIDVSIGGIEYERTYQVGDITYLPTIAKSDLYLISGVDGDDLYTFGVQGDIDSFPDYLFDRQNPQRYYDRRLQFQFEDGIIPLQVGDVFYFAIEGGHFAWRKDGGAWSSPFDIQEDAQMFDAGLLIAFDFGVSPSFAQNDTWEALCVQENRAANLTAPWTQKWKGTGNITIDMGSSVAIDALIIDRHDLTGTITFQASDLEDFSELLHNETIMVSDLTCKLYLDANSITARYFRLLISGEHEIGHIFLGSAMRLSADADKVRPLRRYSISRQDGKVPFSLFEYLKKGFNIDYDTILENGDYVVLEDMIDYLKQNNDMPCYCVANVNYPDKLCVKGTIDIDNIEPGSDIDLNVPDANRIFTLSLQVVGVQ